MLVTDVSERRILVLFMDGLADPLRGWIKALNPPTLQEAIKKARDMDSSSASKKNSRQGVSLQGKIRTGNLFIERLS